MKLLGQNSKSDFTQKWGSVKVSFKTLHILCGVAYDSVREKVDGNANSHSNDDRSMYNMVSHGYNQEDGQEEDQPIKRLTGKSSKRKRARDKLKNFEGKKKKVEVVDTSTMSTVLLDEDTVAPTLQSDVAEDEPMVESALEVTDPTSVNVSSFNQPLPHAVKHSPPLVRIETFSNQLSEFFKSVASWYHLATPIILQYLRHQLLNVMQMHSNISKEIMYQNYINIAKTLSSTANRNMQRLFINLIATGRGYPLFSAIVYTLRTIDSTDRLIASFDLSTSFESLLDYSKLVASAMRPASKIQVVARAR